ncbi:MAG: hypothetical protein M3Q06_14955 [Bacteroidota bacterium]|nr:hypothetical protein [Bacteroidota bacterium]
MKSLLLILTFACMVVSAKAQSVTAMSPGKYEAKFRNAAKNWEKGDVIILDDNRYRLSGDEEVGEYRFSVAAQRIFFTSGPLKSAFTKVILNNNKPAIVFPTEKNGELGITAEVWASKQ